MEAIAMGSLLEELARRETAAVERVEATREQIERFREPEVLPRPSAGSGGGWQAALYR
ncbi:hypothetical protein ACQPYK_22780 [Streptosporangium sp. CA-135522]|uniref:hypothetical protein n=1 Tax=Streptosporangium sp. CA-135522 TaxID=3240072 RepID=UPI003D8A0CD3